MNGEPATGSQMLVGNRIWSAFFNPTNQLLRLRTGEKFPLAQRARCPIAQCILFGANRAAQLESSNTSRHERSINRLTIIRTGPHGGGRRWPGRINHLKNRVHEQQSVCRNYQVLLTYGVPQGSLVGPALFSLC